MQAQQAFSRYGASGSRRLAAMIGLAVALLAALALAVAYGFYLKGVSLQSAPAAPVQATSRQQAPDAAERNAQIRAAQSPRHDDSWAVDARVVPHDQSWEGSESS